MSDPIPEAASESSEDTATVQKMPNPEREANTAVACSNHPRVNADKECARCSTQICGTCAFTFPDNLILCPSCATAKPEMMTDKRRKGRLISFIMAGVATLAIVLLFSGVFAGAFERMSDAEFELIVGWAFTLLTLVPSIIGFSFGIGALNKRRGNPISIIVPTVWNGILLGIWILLTIIGNFE